MAQIVGGSTFRLAGAHRQQRLGAAQSLDLTLFIHTEHESVEGRIHVDTDNVAHLFDQQRVFGENKGLLSMRLQPESPPDAADSRLVETQAPGHEPRAPVGGALWCAFQRGHHHLFHLLITHLARRSWTRFIEQSIHPFFQKAFSPMADRLFMDMKLMGYLQVASAFGALQDDPRPQRQGPRATHTPGLAVPTTSALLQ